MPKVINALPFRGLRNRLTGSCRDAFSPTGDGSTKDARKGASAKVRQLLSQLSFGRTRKSAETCRIRPLGPGDAFLIILHYALLGSNGRRFRFGARTTFAALTRRYGAIDWSSTQFLGAFAGGKLVGLAEVAACRFGGEPSREAAFSVHSTWRGLGLGRKLLAAVRHEVCERRRETLIVYTRPDNARMIRILAAAGAVRCTQDGETLFVLPPAS